MKNPKDHKKAMEYASCVDTQSHLKKCRKCREEVKDRSPCRCACHPIRKDGTTIEFIHCSGCRKTKLGLKGDY